MERHPDHSQGWHRRCVKAKLSGRNSFRANSNSQTAIRYGAFFSDKA
jgi:hypothetical protein